MVLHCINLRVGWMEAGSGKKQKVVAELLVTSYDTCQKPNITKVQIYWDNQKFGQSCDIILDRIKFGVLCKPGFA